MSCVITMTFLTAAMLPNWRRFQCERRMWKRQGRAQQKRLSKCPTWERMGRTRRRRTSEKRQGKRRQRDSPADPPQTPIENSGARSGDEGAAARPREPSCARGRRPEARAAGAPGRPRLRLGPRGRAAPSAGGRPLRGHCAEGASSRGPGALPCLQAVEGNNY
ncbi:unnamed protein product [Prorocentrum cordatum]|uniref:Uncharacterized protein n=2 Tax=Prorocentrum cordatum TaxID=2364126 RepID=A0ABN9T625_9DINO|nr:unnamed protein product [Polarella glacialis]